MRFVFIVACLIILMGWLSPFGSSNISVKTKDGFVSAESKGHYFEFDIGSQSTSSLHLLDLRKTSGFIRKMGFDFHVAGISHQHYQQFLDLINSGSCPARFLNQHAQNLMLVSSDAASKAALRRLVGRHDTGTKITLSGEILKFALGEVKGRKMHSFSFGGATPIFVRTVSTYTQGK